MTAPTTTKYCLICGSPMKAATSGRHAAPSWHCPNGCVTAAPPDGLESMITRGENRHGAGVVGRTLHRRATNHEGDE